MQDVKTDRNKYIGGSDIPVIMNLSPFKTRYELLLEKAGYKRDTFEGNAFTEFGNILEPVIRDYINLTQKSKFKEGKHVREAEGDEPIGVRLHTDGENPREILEIKTTSQIYEDVNEYKIYLVQLLFYMVNTGKEKGTLAVYERPEDLSTRFDADRLHVFNIKLEDYGNLIKEIGDALELFVEDLRKVKENPFITEEELLPTEITDITQRILAFEYQLKQMKYVEAQIKEEKARLKLAMERASVKSWTTPSGYKITLIPDGEDKAETVKIFNEDEFKKEYAGLYEKYLDEKTVIKKGRSGYVKITEPRQKKEA